MGTSSFTGRRSHSQEGSGLLTSSSAALLKLDSGLSNARLSLSLVAALGPAKTSSAYAKHSHRLSQTHDLMLSADWMPEHVELGQLCKHLARNKWGQ